MSIRVMSQVWEIYPGSGSELLAMLALADWSDDNGKCYPSMSSIAKKTRLSRSQARRVVHQLIDDGFLVVTANALGGSPTQTRHYKIVLSHLTRRTDATPTGSAHATGSADATGCTHAQEGSHPCANRGSAHATQTVIEPSLTVNTMSGKPNGTQPTESKSKTTNDTCIAILHYLNEKTGSKFQPVASNLKLIKARLSEGATVVEMKQVVDQKNAEWKSDEKMSDYLRPATLFNAKNYAQYSGQLGKVKTGISELGSYI